MVLDAILGWWFDVVEGFISLFPASDLPTTVVDLSFMADINYFIPVGEMFGLFINFFALGGPLAGTSLIIWFLIGILRGGSTKA